MNQFQSIPLIDLPPQPLDEDFDRFRERVEALVPDVGGDVGAADDLYGASGEVFEQRVLLGRQIDLLAAPSGASPRLVRPPAGAPR